MIEFEFEPPFSYIVVGNSGSGKTTLVKHLMKEYFLPMFTPDSCKSHDEDEKCACKPPRPNIFIMSNTITLSGDFDEYLYDKNGEKNKRCFDQFDPSVIDEIIEEQKTLLTYYPRKRVPQVLLILDDVLEHLHESKVINTLFHRGRHYKISVILLVQKMKSVSTLQRINVKYLTLFRSANEHELESFLDEYTGKSQRNALRAVLVEWFKKPWSFLHCNLKTQNFQHRYALGADCHLIKYVI